MMAGFAKAIILALLVFGFQHISPNAPAFAQVQQQASVASLQGNYRVEGRNPDGSAYSGSLTIRDVDGVANFEWRVGSRAYRGQGSFIGNVLVVNWGSDAPVIYTIGLDGNLAGTWANGRASERLLRQ